MEGYWVSVRVVYHSRPAHLDGGRRLRPYCRTRSEWKDPRSNGRARAGFGAIGMGPFYGSWTRSQDLCCRSVELAFPGLYSYCADRKDGEVRSVSEDVLGVGAKYGLVFEADEFAEEIECWDVLVSIDESFTAPSLRRLIR